MGLKRHDGEQIIDFFSGWINYRYFSKKLNIMKNVNIFCHPFQKVNPIFYIDSLHIEWNMSSLYFLKFWWNLDDYGLQIMKTPNSVSPHFNAIRINKKYIFNRNVRLLKSMFISMHSILGWASFCMNYCINVAWHGASQPVALLRCNGSPGGFESGLQVICIVGSGVSHLPLDNTP